MSQAAAVEILQVGVSTGQREIDVIQDAGIAGAGLAGRAGHEAFGERRDRRGVGMVEECAVLLPVGCCAPGAAAPPSICS